MQQVIIYCLADDSQKAKDVALVIRNHGNKAMIRDGAVFRVEDAEKCDVVLVLDGCDNAIFEYYGDKASVLDDKQKTVLENFDETEESSDANTEAQGDIQPDEESGDGSESDTSSKSNKARRAK